ncbi:cation diffusion facilitator family transporter [Streptacidiphilus jiangxiensis]|uniref:Cation efflux family protein n=1 Tax=Streptacidiphilus jiangxiensis TaxID=235985 RepID=A0A1H7MZD6_STRJI|nr:cation transporter [Streptacidiphilus jiangxiensis]SEL16620.1 Cation efflux family protein [Streptacidiphilus jiangxiensis]
MTAPATGRQEPVVAGTGGCHCEPGCADPCCRPPVERDAAWHAAARKAKLLSWLSLGYMAAEGAVAITAAVLAGSVALLGFGLDSVIEGLASVIIVWRFSGTRTLSETAEGRARKAVAVTFFLLAPYIAYDAISTLAQGEHPSTSRLGIALSAVSLVVMPLLGRAKRRLGRILDSGATAGEGTQNLLCAYLAAAVLVGLLANTLFGLWWLDPAVGLLVAGLAVREGSEAWRGEECAC